MLDSSRVQTIAAAAMTVNENQNLDWSAKSIYVSLRAQSSYAVMDNFDFATQSSKRWGGSDHVAEMSYTIEANSLRWGSTDHSDGSNESVDDSRGFKENQ